MLEIWGSRTEGENKIVQEARGARVTLAVERISKCVNRAQSVGIFRANNWAGALAQEQNNPPNLRFISVLIIIKDASSVVHSGWQK